MGSYTWGTGTDIFAVDYIDTQVPESGNNQWKSADAKNHMLAAIELKNLTGYYEAGSDTATSHISDTNTPFNRGTDGASTGYYRTLYYTSKTKDDYFFTQNVLMYDRHIITNISDIQRLIWKPTITKTTQTVTLIDGTTASITIYSVQSFQSNKIDILKKNDPEQITATGINVIPALISPTVSDALQTFPYWNRDSESITWVDGTVHRYAQTYGTGSNNVARYCPFISDNKLIFPNSDNETTRYVVDKSGKYILSVRYRAGDQYSYMTNMYANARYYIIDEDEFLHVLARSGLKFEYENTLYKPLAENGVIVGYTDDMTKTSEWDNWHDYNDHEVPITPPVPPPTPGYDDDPWHGASFSGVSVGGIGAFARCYYMTSTELQNLRSWMGSINVPEGFDPMAQIIGLSQVPVALSGDDAENIKFINSSAVYDPGVTTRVVDSGVASQYSMGLPKKFSLGSIDIARRMQERGEPYLDYSCQIELYLPLIGMFSLDTQTVMGRTIEAEAVLDPVSGTLAAYAWVSKDGQKLPIAYGSTTIGVDLPITAQQYSVAKAALKQANAQLATSLLSSALTMVASASASGKAAAYGNGRATAASGMRNAREGFNSFTNAASIAASQTMVSQTGSVFGSFMDWGRSIRQLSYGNNTAISGSFGGSTAQWSYPFTAYVKIIRPRFEKPLNYAHTQGVPCVQSKKVGSCIGFIQCVGVDVSGITRATDIERQAIQAALTNGVYAGVGGGE